MPRGVHVAVVDHTGVLFASDVKPSQSVIEILIRNELPAIIRDKEKVDFPILERIGSQELTLNSIPLFKN